MQLAAEEPNTKLYLFINGRWKFLITNPRKPFACPNRWVQRWLALREPTKPRVQTPLLPLLSINITMQTRLCQLNLFSNFPQGERVALTLRPVCHLSPHNSTCSVHPLFSLCASTAPLVSALIGLFQRGVLSSSFTLRQVIQEEEAAHGVYTVGAETISINEVDSGLTPH